MQQERLNTSTIESFIKTVKQADASKSKEIRLDMQQAKDLAYTMSIMLARLHGKMEDFVTTQQPSQATEIVQIKMDGGSDWK